MTCRLCYEYRRTLTMSEFTILFWPHGGGFLVQRSIQGRAAEMGLKISLLVYHDPLFSANTVKTWGIFQNLFKWREIRPNFHQSDTKI